MKSNRRCVWIQVKIDLRAIWLVEVDNEIGNDFYLNPLIVGTFHFVLIVFMRLVNWQ